jgi:ThiF family
LPNIATVAPGALDRFVLDLVEAGFETTDGRLWRGPIDPSLADLTTATTMRVRIENGWPYRHPHLYVDGLLPSVHLNGTVLCLWRVGDDSLAWLRLDDLRARIAQWSDRYRGRTTLDDPVLDAHLYWVPVNSKILATVDLSRIKWGDGGSGDTTAELNDDVLKIGEKGNLKVRWYGREDMRHPPINMAMLTEGLKKDQARNLERELARVGKPGGLDILMLVWDSPVGEPNVLVLRLSRGENDEIRGEALEVARTDQEVLMRRAGPDAPTLRAKSVVIFGQGAIGSNLSLLLARSGVGKIMAVDGERLRPGDLVRHAGITVSVGSPKVEAVALMASVAAPWTEVRPIRVSTWDPDALDGETIGADLVIDAVGEVSFTDQLSRRLIAGVVPMLSVALFRGGSVARVRIRASGGVPLHERVASDSFPMIPPGPMEETPSWETGCAAPVNNAPPVAVVSAAALAARVAIEVLTGRENGNFDAIEVYHPLETSPFDAVGYLRYDG